MRKFAETAVSFLKALWDRIWNDKPKETEFPEVLAESHFCRRAGSALCPNGPDPRCFRCGHTGSAGLSSWQDAFPHALTKNPDYEKDGAYYRSILVSMHEKLSRRGPDDAGIYLSRQCGLSHSRLSIIDLSLGHQPMVRRKGERTCAIAYNGELYNAKELRRELQEKGWIFETSCDTEEGTIPAISNIFSGAHLFHTLEHACSRGSCGTDAKNFVQPFSVIMQRNCAGNCKKKGGYLKHRAIQRSFCWDLWNTDRKLQKSSMEFLRLQF